MDLIRTRRIYALAAAGTLLFSAVYESFSHGVMSRWMILAFLVPLLGGYVPCALLRRAPWTYRPGTVSACLYHSSMAAMTVGCIFRGVMEIFGSTSRFSGIYTAAWIALLAASVLSYGIERVRDRKIYMQR